MEKKMLNMGRRLLRLLTEKQDHLNKEYEKLYPYRDIVMRTSYRRKEGKTYYQRQTPEGRKYLGTGENEIVKRIKKAKYISCELDMINSDISLLTKLLNDYRIVSHETVDSRLPKVYRLHSLDYYEDLPDAGKEWMRRKEAEKAEYGPWHPEGLIHTVSNGIKVRTKSEMAIAEILLRNGIPFVYELPHVLKNGKIVHTDFTILSTIDYKTEILLEHEGSMADSGYRDKHAWRVENYYLSGYVPNVNIFFTYDGMNGSVDGESIQRIVDGWFRPADNLS